MRLYVIARAHGSGFKHLDPQWHPMQWHPMLTGMFARARTGN